MKPHKISTHLAFSDNCYSHLFYRLSDWVEILWGFTKFNFKLNLKVSAFYLEKQKSFIPEKNIFLAVVNIKTKKLCLLTQFSRRFWFTCTTNIIMTSVIKRLLKKLYDPVYRKIQFNLTKPKNPYLHFLDIWTMILSTLLSNMFVIFRTVCNCKILLNCLFSMTL